MNEPLQIGQLPSHTQTKTSTCKLPVSNKTKIKAAMVLIATVSAATVVSIVSKPDPKAKLLDRGVEWNGLYFKDNVYISQKNETDVVLYQYEHETVSCPEYIEEKHSVHFDRENCFTQDSLVQLKLNATHVCKDKLCVPREIPEGNALNDYASSLLELVLRSDIPKPTVVDASFNRTTRALRTIVAFGPQNNESWLLKTNSLLLYPSDPSDFPTKLSSGSGDVRDLLQEAISRCFID